MRRLSCNWIRWLFPSREAQRPRAPKAHAAKPRVRLRLEEFETRTVPTTITRTSASIFYNDLPNNLTSAYAAYQITNTDGVNYSDVWATIGNFAAASGQPVVTLAPNAAGAIDLGPLAAGQTKTAFFYLGSTADTNVTQTHTVSVFTGPPASGTLLTSQNFSFTSVQSTIQSNADKVSSVVISPSTPTIGGTFTMTVTGQTGTIGAAKVLSFTPATFSAWRADAFQLVGTTITFSGANTGTFANTLLIPPALVTSTADTTYTAVYTFQVVGPTAAPTAVSPVTYISSGANVDHTTTGNFSTLPPIQPPQLASPTLITAPTPATVTLGTTPLTLTDSATLANGFRPTGMITFSLVAPGGATVDTEAVAVNGNGTYTPTGFTLPKSGTATGTYQWNATYSGDTKNNSASDIGASNEKVIVSRASPTLVTTASPNVTLPAGPPGTVTLSDTADLEGGYFPTGTIVFTLTGPGGFIYTQTDTVSGNGTSTASTTPPISGPVAGTYTWTAHYGGDSNNVVANDQGGIAEKTVVSMASPTLTTTPSPGTATVGSSIADQATVIGYHPTGAVTFNLYNNPNGAGTPLFSAPNRPLSGGIATSARYTTTATGTYYWVATYNGDSNNSPATSGTAQEPVKLTPATPSITTAQQPATAAVGTPIADTAIVFFGFKPTGTVTFTLYSNPNASGTPLFTDPNVPLVNGTAKSAGYTPTATGTVYWVATYHGDSNNNAVASGTAREPVTIGPAVPKIKTLRNSGSATVDSTIFDLATITGGFNPTGTVTFNLYNNRNGTGSPLFTDTEPLLSGGLAKTGFTPTLAGTVYWVATYNGDSNNSPVTSGTADEPVTITKAQPQIKTQQQPATATVGTTIADKATVIGGFNPTGTVTFNLYSNPNGMGTPLFTDTEPLSIHTAVSKSYTATATGTVYWVATYNGDSNNSPFTSGTAVEPVVISKATPMITTSQQPPAAPMGTSIADTATVTGGFNPTGTVTFKLYNNPNGTGTPLFTDTEPLSGGMATSAGFSTTVPGTVYWVATYNGDANNAVVASGSALERVVITSNTPAIGTEQQPARAFVGSTIADRAAVTSGLSPTGTVTFNLYNNPNGAGTPLFTDTEPLSGGLATSAGYTTTATGTVYWVATYNGDANNGPVTSGTALEPVVITPVITTSQQPATATLGSTIADQATISGGANPAGTVTFNLYNNPSASGTPLFTDTEPLAGGAATSAGFTTTAVGTDYWVATYNGDANNGAVTSGAADEPVVITTATLAINTSQQPATATVGTSFADKATVTGGFNVTGTVTFNLYNNPNGTGTALFADTEPLSGGTATSNSYTATATGIVYWVATYNGDSNNSAVTCGMAVEPVVISKATPAINTSQQPATAAIGSSIADEATVTGGFNPTGTVTFNLYNNPNGAGTPLFTDTEPLAIDAAASKSYTATATGTYYWVATYSGDSNNSPVTSGIADEPVVITAATPAIGTSQRPASATVGASISDMATVSGGFNPTGTVTFNVYDNPNGTGTPLITNANVPLSGGMATSTGYPTTATGTVYWVATYNGDNNNSSMTSGVALEPVTITPATPVINTSQQPASVTIVRSIVDIATVSGGFNPTGTVTFKLYNNPNGTGTPLFTDTEPLSGGMATSAGYPTTATGTVYWVATYNGDSNNGPVTSGLALEPVTITPATPVINTSQQPATATVGTSFADEATVTGGFNLTGTVTFNLYNNPNGTGTALFAGTEPLSGGTATSNSYTATAPGTVYWVATYNGDSNNAKVTSGNALEPVVITKATPSISTSQQPAGTTVGSAIADMATVTGGFNPTGTVTFNVYDNPNGTGTPLFSDTEPLSGGTALSKGYTVTADGTVYWVATYNGDSNNNPITSGTALEPVQIPPPVADLSLTMTVSQSQVYFGMNVTYTFIERNLGPNTATGVTVADRFPPGLVFFSASTPSQGTYHPVTGSWTVGTLANGAVATLQVTFQVMRIGAIVNTAHTAAVEYDPDPLNNVAAKIVYGLAPIISKRMFLARAF
jgi:hypothetical protein